MSGFLGADTQALREYAEKARAASSRLSELRDALSSSVASVEWRGADGDAFRDDFSGRVSGMFDAVGGRLERAGDDLIAQADEQDAASEAGGESRGGDEGSGDPLADLLANPINAVAGTLKDVIGAGGKAWKAFKQGRSLMNLRAAMNTLGPAAESAQTFIRSGMVDDAAGFLGKLGTAGKFLGGAGGVLGIVGGISDMINPAHDGWRGVGDRVAGGLSVIGGAGGLAVALGAGAALGPVGLGVVAVAGVGAGLWAAGNAIVDNWDSISSFAGDVGGHVSDFVSDAGDAIGGAADAVGDFVGGLF